MTPYEEYRAAPGLNFSSLASYYNAGVHSPDHALMTVDFKSYFEYGRQFESMLQDAVTGSTTFSDRFYFTELENKMPDELIEWIDTGIDLTTKYEYTKKGDLSLTYKGRHAYLDEALKNPGKIPVSKPDGEMLKRHTENMLKMKYLDTPVGDILANAKWQVPVYWTDEVTGLKCKALVDVLVDLGGEFLPVDIKTAAGFKKFSYMLRDKYFIQDLHYIEGVNATIGSAMPMVFFVASKESPYLCQPWQVDYGDVDWRIKAIEQYRELCQEYQEWRNQGRPPKGWLPLGMAKFYPREA
jgi:hypothetical protein